MIIIFPPFHFCRFFSFPSSSKENYNFFIAVYTRLLDSLDILVRTIFRTPTPDEKNQIEFLETCTTCAVYLVEFPVC